MSSAAIPILQVGSGAPSAPARSSLADVPIDEIVAEGNIREFRTDDEHGRGLRDSVKTMGILQPVLLSPLRRRLASGERYRLVAGFRRYAAACESGCMTVPARIVTLSESDVLLARITENAQRLGTTPMEDARAVSEYLRLTGCTQAEVARRLGKSATWVFLRLRIMELPAEVREMIGRREVTIGQLTQILTLPPTDEKGICDLALEAKNGMPSAGLRNLAASRMYRMAGGKGEGPRRLGCAQSCTCTCPCCLLRRRE